MPFTADSGETKCILCSDTVSKNLLRGTVGIGGNNGKADVRRVQELLNSLSPVLGGPDAHLAEDGICGPKTQAAINAYQRKVLTRPDGRIDVNGPTITSLAKVICESPIVVP